MNRVGARFLRTLATIVAAALTLAVAPAAPSRAAADAPASWSDGIPRAKPEEVGLSTERLARIGKVMAGHVAAGDIVGATGAIARHGKLAYFETWGDQDREAGTPMAKDTIFRIYSMSKAVTGVAVLMLYEEQGFPLTTPVARWLPELGDMKVAVEGTDPGTGDRTYRLEPARRRITVIDLLSHTSGLSYAGPRDERGERIYAKLGLSGPGAKGLTLAEAVRKLGTAPLHDQPGTVWRYGYSIDVLGRLVEVLSGQPFDEFLEQRIFRPLGMRDSGFWVPPEKKGRLAALYTPAEDGKVVRHPGPPQNAFFEKPAMFSGGGGLVSTTADYLRFCEMLLQGGELGGRRLLSPKTVALASSDHIGDIPRSGNLLGPGDGFGLTFRVNLSPGRNGALGSVGEYGWGGAAGTRFSIDPAEDMVTLYMVQILPHTGLTYGAEFKNLAYQAIVK